MSVFSTVLMNYIQKKEIPISSLAKYCDTDRSTMYKIINGKRNPPSPELFHKISGFLRLTPLEYQQLEEAWKITLTGPEIYYRRKSVENFISCFPAPSPQALPGQALLPSQKQSSVSGAAALTSQVQINTCLHRILLAESAQKSGQIGLFLQPDPDFLFSLLASLKPSDSLNIQHILCLTGSDLFTGQHQLYNLRCLQKIFPLYMAGLNYSPRYFYDYIQSHYYNLNGFSCLILTSQAAVMCDSDFQTGIYYDSREILNLLWKQYHAYYDSCTPLFLQTPVDPENSSAFFRLLLDTDDRDTAICIQPEACLTPFITEDMLNRIFNHSLPEGKQIFQCALQTFSGNFRKLQLGRFFLYFTEEGVMHFARTGLMEEIPPVFYTPLSVAQRIQILESVRFYCLEGSYRILGTPLNHLPENLRLCVRSETCSIMFKNNTGSIILFQILESSFLNTFRDYLQNVSPESFYPPEKAADFICQVIHSLQEETL